MGREKLDQYKGPLSPADVAAGMNAANGNARRLAEDAALLLERGRFPTAAALAALAIEEAGKTSILRGLSLARDEQELKEAWREYRSHTKKNAVWILPSLVADGARSLDDFRSMYDPGSDHPHVLDQLKQLGFYTDCLGQAHWAISERIIDERLARSPVDVANLLAREKVITAEEIELWVEHMRPVWKGPMPWMKQALLDWHRAMRARGLALDDEISMERFVGGDERQG